MGAFGDSIFYVFMYEIFYVFMYEIFYVFMYDLISRALPLIINWFRI